jgi:hypothetical protein
MVRYAPTLELAQAASDASAGHPAARDEWSQTRDD